MKGSAGLATLPLHKKSHMTKQEFLNKLIESDIDLNAPLPFGDGKEKVEDFYKAVMADCLRDREGIVSQEIIKLCTTIGIITVVG